MARPHFIDLEPTCDYLEGQGFKVLALVVWHPTLKAYACVPAAGIPLRLVEDLGNRIRGFSADGTSEWLPTLDVPGGHS